MLLPIGDDNYGRRTTPVVVYALVAANILVFIAQIALGDQFTVADGYLFTVTNWANFLKIDLSAYPNVTAFQARVGARPKVQAALKAEGLLK